MSALCVLLPLALGLSAAPNPPAMRAAETLDFRIEASRQPYLVRIPRAELQRLADAAARGAELPQAPGALTVREDLYPPQVLRGIPPEVARKAVALWTLVRERGWTTSAGVEWDPDLGHPARVVNDRGDILRDALGPSQGSRASVWTSALPAGSRDPKAFGVRCLASFAGPKRCFRLWPAGPSRGRP